MEDTPNAAPGSTLNPVRDVLVVGGGPAGLSAALILLRARRSVVMVDAGQQRNLVSPRMHGFLSRDGMPPAEFLTLCTQELETYEAFTLLRGTLTDCRKEESIFIGEIKEHPPVRARVVLLALGVTDTLPAIEGIEDYYGKCVHHCPYCDGWEYRDQPIIVYGEGGQAANLAWELTGWSREVTLLIQNQSALLPRHLARLEKSGVTLIEGTPLRLEGDRVALSGLILQNGTRLPARSLFFVADETPRPELATRLRCEFEGRHPRVSPSFSTSVEGCFAAGNLCKGRNMVVIAAAQGAEAAMAINEYLMETML